MHSDFFFFCPTANLRLSGSSPCGRRCSPLPSRLQFPIRSEVNRTCRLLPNGRDCQSPWGEWGSMGSISAGVVTGRKDEVTERAVLGTGRVGRGLSVRVLVGHPAGRRGN